MKPNATRKPPPLPAPLVVFAGHGRTELTRAEVDASPEGMAAAFRRVYVAALVRCLGSDGRN